MTHELLVSHDPKAPFWKPQKLKVRNSSLVCSEYVYDNPARWHWRPSNYRLHFMQQLLILIQSLFEIELRNLKSVFST